jgi:hypothetical protein
MLLLLVLFVYFIYLLVLIKSTLFWNFMVMMGCE